MANELDKVKNDFRFYILWLALWILLGFFHANQMACIGYHSCDAGDFVSYLIVQISLLAPAGIASWIVMSIVNSFTNTDN